MYYVSDSRFSSVFQVSSFGRLNSELFAVNDAVKLLAVNDAVQLLAVKKMVLGALYFF